MGLIRAAVGAAGSTLADQWKEFFYCDAMPGELLVVKGHKRTSSRSANTRGSDNVITSGSGIAVADGQCVLIVDQGRIVEACAEPGEFTYDASAEPSIFSGNLTEPLEAVFETVGKRFTRGGDTGRDQRVYYINIKELMDNKFGTPTPVPFRVVDRNIGLDLDTSIRCSGVYSYRIVNPLLFYANVCGNVEREFTRDQIEKQLKTEFVSALQPAFAKMSALEIRPSAIPGHVEELCTALNEALTQKWAQTRGLSVVSVAISSLNLPEEDAEMIRQAQRMALLKDPSMAAATLTGAQADALRTAAGNSAGAMTGFMGMGMASGAGGMNVQDLYRMGAQREESRQQEAQTQTTEEKHSGWTCVCGADNESEWKFCHECGSRRPEEGWTCACGTLNKGKFCTECGSPKPDEAPLYRCDKCGWEPEDPYHPPKFCPECGDPFEENDRWQK